MDVSWHIPLTERKALCGRLKYFESFQKHESGLNLAGQTSRLNRIWLEIERLTNEVVPEGPLDHYLTDTLVPRVINLVLADTVKTKIEDVDPPLAVALEDFRLATERLSCAVCSPEQICSGEDDDKDDAIVSQTGLCIRPLKQIFVFAQKVADTYYRQYCSFFDQRPLPSLLFSTAFCPDGKPHKLPVSHAVTGVTLFVDEGDQAISELRLVIGIKSFDWNTFLAMPYVLLHESLCHGFQWLDGDVGTRVQWQKKLRQKNREESEEDGFSEGWMDWVAIRIFEEIKNGRGPCANLPNRYECWANHHVTHDHYDQGKPLCDARIVLPPEGRTAAVWARQGRVAAQRVEKFCQFICKTLPEMPENSWDFFLRLSFSINVLCLEVNERNCLTTFLDTHVRRWEEDHFSDVLSQTGRHADSYALLAPLINYLRDPDIKVFINRMRPHYWANVK